MTLPSADEFLTGVSKHAHGSVDGLEDSENKKIDWRAVGAGLRHYSRVSRMTTYTYANSIPRRPTGSPPTRDGDRATRDYELRRRSLIGVPGAFSVTRDR